MVAMNVWPTDAADGSVSNEARWRKMARYWSPSGVLMQGTGVNAEFSPISLTMPNLSIGAGIAWVDGHFCELLGPQVLAVTANGLAVVRFDPAANTAELVYRDAATAPAVNPIGVTEIPIAKIVGSALVEVRQFVHPNMPGSYFPSSAARDLNIPTPRLGMQVYDAGAGGRNEYSGGGWKRPPWIRYVQQDVSTTYIDQNLAVAMNDASGVWPVESVSRITVSLGTTGWAAGVVPSADVYTNDVGYPWGSGLGFDYCYVQGKPFTAGSVGGGGALPQNLPPLIASQWTPAGSGGLTWTVRMFVHTSPGAIPINYYIHAVMERFPIGKNAS